MAEPAGPSNTRPIASAGTAGECPVCSKYDTQAVADRGATPGIPRYHVNRYKSIDPDHEVVAELKYKALESAVRCFVEILLRMYGRRDVVPVVAKRWMLYQDWILDTPSGRAKDWAFVVRQALEYFAAELFSWRVKFPFIEIEPHYNHWKVEVIVKYYTEDTQQVLRERKDELRQRQQGLKEEYLKLKGKAREEAKTQLWHIQDMRRRIGEALGDKIIRNIMQFGGCLREDSSASPEEATIMPRAVNTLGNNSHGDAIRGNAEAGQKCCRCREAMHQDEALPCGPVKYDPGRSTGGSTLQPGQEERICIFCRVLFEITGQVKRLVDKNHNRDIPGTSRANVEYAQLGQELDKLYKKLRKAEPPQRRIAGRVGEREELGGWTKKLPLDPVGDDIDRVFEECYVMEKQMDPTEL
ncbi:hypothetical protein Micbo1qcDRAFT_178494 [Microdochium bolleyi]|uniref:Uncharacterized protein n=1 Tax=Microdochium bolleyi TaxID=196109 RepID=A0A136ISA5_9PEZI|nr:hypothetical protein Micbo1qcDRAFT_178494 [Microdochium bolleyi]